MMRTGLFYKILWLISLTALLLTGCSGSTPRTEFYTLNTVENPFANDGAVASGQPVSIGIGPVVIPAVLNRPQIVTRTSPYKLQINEFHRWAARLDEDMARVVAENISVLMPTDQIAVYPWDVSFKPRFQVTLDFQHFEGRNGQEVFLEVFWKIIDPQEQKTLRVKKSVIKEPLPADDYETLVAAKSRTLDELSKLIVKKIKDF